MNIEPANQSEDPTRIFILVDPEKSRVGGRFELKNKPREKAGRVAEGGEVAEG